MTTIRMTLEPGPGHRWAVTTDDARPEYYTCPIQALLRAKHRYHQIPASEAGALLISLDGEHSTKLLARPAAPRRSAEVAHFAMFR